MIAGNMFLNIFPRGLGAAGIDQIDVLESKPRRWIYAHFVWDLCLPPSYLSLVS